MSAAERYDQIGTDYAAVRRPDSRWVARIHQALDGHRTLVNVGAGAGSYEPRSMSVVGVEPSEIMIRQRSSSAAPVVRGVAEQLPFPNGAFDVALAVLTVHHWSDPSAGLAEMRRVSRKQVVVTWDPEVFARQFWLVRDYLPEAAERETQLATLATVLAHLGPATTEKLLIPEDCADGFFGAYWRRPHAYLDATVRGAISGLALLDRGIVSAAMDRLKSDLGHGRWHARYSELMELREIDLGYRLVVAELGSPNRMVRIRKSVEADSAAMLAIVNDAAQAYRGVIPPDRWRDPYMPADELEKEIADGVVFWVTEEDGRLLAVMGIQDKGEVALVRHAYVAPNVQRKGVGTSLLRHVQGLTGKPVLIGTWADASWAIEFYRRNGFTVVPHTHKNSLLRRYWSIPARQAETSVVLADARWMEAQQR